MARLTATNFSGGLQFPYATGATDLFKKEDVQTLAQAVDQHDHTSGKGHALPAAAVQQLLGQYSAGTTFSTTLTGLVDTPVTVSVTATGGLVRVEYSLTLQHSLAGGQVLLALAHDTIPESVGYAYFSIAGQLITVSGTRYLSGLAAGAHAFVMKVQNVSGSGTLSIASSILAWLYVTEQKT